MKNLQKIDEELVKTGKEQKQTEERYLWARPIPSNK